ncbi:conserved hypothetical protein [Vibrio diabolicus]|nr:conserved hypothetical protein [Vibrio diabolicus]
MGNEFLLNIHLWDENNEISYLRHIEQHGNDVDQERTTHKVVFCDL